MSYRSVVLADGPVSYWRLDETSGTNAADQQGTNAGTYTPTFTLNQAGALGGSGDSDAAVLCTNGYVNAPTFSPFVSGGSQTFEGWANTADAGNLVLFGGTAAAGPSLFFDTLTTLSFYPQNSAAVTWDSVWPGYNVWVYWAFTWNDSTKTGELFINGVSQTAKTCTQAYGTPGTFQLANLKSGHAFFGYLDEYAVYSSILSATQIANHYTAGTTVTTVASHWSPSFPPGQSWNAW